MDNTEKLLRIAIAKFEDGKKHYADRAAALFLQLKKKEQEKLIAIKNQKRIVNCADTR